MCKPRIAKLKVARRPADGKSSVDEAWYEAKGRWVLQGGALAAEAVGAVKGNGDRAIVDQGDVHVRLENACLNG